MSSDTKKVVLLLSGALGIAFIAIGTTLIIQKLNQPAPQPAPVPVVAQQTQPQQPPMAQVIAVKPHYEDVSAPHKSCKQVAHVVYEQRDNGAPIAGAAVGGIAGGMIGHSIGGNDHAKMISSAAGAAIGALSGGYVQKSIEQPKPQTVYSTQCSSYHSTKSVQKGYEVTYTYQGRRD